MVRIRLMRMGKKKYPVYRVVAKHNLSPRQGDALEFLGFYDPKRKVGKVNLEAVEYNIPIVYVDPKNTSRTCPICGTPLNFQHRLAICPKCRFTADRDTVGAMNIYKRAFKILAPSAGSGGTTPMTDEARARGGQKR
ncbi:MAG TPA: 30S ribosomal protein S16 [Aquificae bacterium]|nr:30S ribosomal protein S16 [Aquificota bacterium]